ncbi:MAG: exo-alpha-sialidase [Phycisphaeraceae bacterium]|nr:exo-alpha-sialidase [Phycisphaeraceae bacterium]
MGISRRDFLGASLAVMSGSLWPTLKPAWAQNAADILDEPQFDFSDAEKKRLRLLMSKNLLRITPVASIPEGQPLRHLGWPVATQLPSGRMVVVYQRAGGHGDDDPSPEAGTFVLYSDDDGKTWQPNPPLRLGGTRGMNCIGHASVGNNPNHRLIACSDRMVYLSDDSGQSWREHPHTFDGLLEGAPHTGPNMVLHPEFGLTVAFGQQTGKSGRNFLLRSLDAGETWQQRIWINDQPARDYEPTLATWGPGHMVTLGRETREDFAVGPDGWAYTQHVYRHQSGARFEDVQFVTARTNIVGNQAVPIGGNDTGEVIYNPVSRRIEMLQSARNGGGPGKVGSTLIEDKDKQISSLNLYSIDPEALLAGSSEWRFDCTVIERIGYSMKGNKDGLHPGGSVVDTTHNVQHIFVYAGWRRSPASIFMISRSLETDKMRLEG